MHALFGIEPPVTRKGISLSSRIRTRWRRLRYWLRGFAWFGIFAVLTGLAAVVVSITDQPLSRVIALGFLSCVLAILSIKET